MGKANSPAELLSEHLGGNRTVYGFDGSSQSKTVEKKLLNGTPIFDGEMIKATDYKTNNVNLVKYGKDQ